MMSKTVDRQTLERFFERGTLSRSQFLQGLAGLGMSLTAIALVTGVDTPVVEASPSSSPHYLCLIVLDAFRPDYTTLGPMPALTALIRSGTTYDRAWVGQLESETPTGHASLSTGCLPNRSGIIGFEWRDPASGKEVLDGWPKGVLAGKMESDLREAGAPSIPLAIKSADPAATVVALSSEKIYAAAAMGGWAADYILFHQRVGNPTTSLMPRGLPGHEPRDEFFTLPHLTMRMPLSHFTDWDYLSGMLALAALKRWRPEALLINLPAADVYGHDYGGPASPAVMAQVAGGIDRNIARIVQAYKAAGMFDQTLFVVTADHGMVPNARAVDSAVTKAAVREAGGQYLFHTGGTAADIYLHNSSTAAAVAHHMAVVPNVTAAYHQVQSQGRYQYELGPGVKVEAKLDEVYRYLLGTFAGPIAPDVVAPFRENTIGGAYTHAHGDHGGLNWGAQHVPLIMAGPGIRSGMTSHFPARLVDVAPTALRLLGLRNVGMDGTVLADALVGAAADEMATQFRHQQAVAAYQDALIAQSTSNISEDRKAGTIPPPSQSQRP